MKLISSLLWSARWLLATGLIASIVGGFGSSVQVAMINRALGTSGSALPRLGAQFAAVSVGVLAARWLSQVQFVRAGQALLARLRGQISHSIAAVPYESLEAIGSARLLAVLTEDINAVAQWITSLPRLVMNAAIVLGCMGYLALLSWRVFLLALLVVGLGSVSYHLAHSRALHSLRASRVSEDELYQHFRTLFEGAKELKLHAGRRREFLSAFVDQSIESTRRLRTAGMTLNSAVTSTGNFLFFVLIGAVVFFLSPTLGEQATTLSGYALVLLYMMLPLEAMLGALPATGRVQVALERIHASSVELPPSVGAALSPAGASQPSASQPSMRHTSASNDPTAAALLPSEPTASALAAPFRSLRLHQVVWSYPRRGDGGFTLGPIDLELRAGEVVFLVGGNGGGKTTLAKLVVGLYAAEGGEVLLNGRRVREPEREHYRQHFSAIFAEFFVFEGLIGIDGPDIDRRARELLEQHDLARYVGVEGGKLSTTKLSSGQRKRLALVVAQLEDRPVHVFDEWAADQDPRHKHQFYHHVLPALKAAGKAVLVITHDDRYFGLADRCLELDYGRIVDVTESRVISGDAARTGSRVADRAARHGHEAPARRNGLGVEEPAE